MRKRKEILISLFVFLGMSVFADEIEETTDIRKYHQQLEEKVFEVEDESEKDKKLDEAFKLGDRRVENAVKNEKLRLEEEEKTESEELKNLEILKDKYKQVLKEAEELTREKEKLVLENKKYKEELEKLTGGK